MEAHQSSQLPEFNSIPAYKWIAAEAPIRDVLNCIRPTSDSEDRRNDVVAYMRRVIQTAVEGVEVFQYGSVPLKTYLPEGDIDLTAISSPDWEHSLLREIYDALLAEAQNGNHEYEIKHIRFIDAEVKLVKCVVNDVIMDITFNQMSGLCALCFLEEMDHLIGKDHLFKRSILLIKSWCYYESHILGSIYGLISTYALETLVLYIFRMYNESLASPLMVLYRFLEYYSKFDWDKFGISIDGPVNLSLLPDVVVENPTHNDLLGGEQLRNQINLYTVPCRIPAGSRPPFIRKVVNIIDPLKTNNNLGRSVHIGNFFRIMLALGYGVRKLSEILGSPQEKVQGGIVNFFGNTLKMNKSKFSLNPRLRFDDLLRNYPNEDDIQPENLNADLESDDLDLADLSGDNNGNMRSLLLSHCIHNLPSYPSVHEYYLLAVQSYRNDSMMVPVPNLPVHQIGTLIPPMGPPIWASGMGHVPPLANPELTLAPGTSYEEGSSSSGTNIDSPYPQSSVPSQEHTRERRLEFGSFGRASITSSEGEQSSFLCSGTRSERVLSMHLPLSDDNEFPPL